MLKHSISIMSFCGAVSPIKEKHQAGLCTAGCLLSPDEGVATVHGPHGAARKVLGFQKGHKQLLSSGLVPQSEPDAAQMSVRELRVFFRV
jgi:hypothetical protein